MSHYPPHIDLTVPCLLFEGNTNKAGYGVLVCDGVHWLAHRKAYKDHFGSVTDGLFVCHACDTPGCIEPRHLFESDHDGNVADMVAKNRHPHGETHGSAKLTWDVIDEIRSAPPRSGGQLARKYGVSRNVIYAIRAGRTWREETRPKAL